MASVKIKETMEDWYSVERDFIAVTTDLTKQVSTKYHGIRAMLVVNKNYGFGFGFTETQKFWFLPKPIMNRNRNPNFREFSPFLLI